MDIIDLLVNGQVGPVAAIDPPPPVVETDPTGPMAMTVLLVKGRIGPAVDTPAAGPPSGYLEVQAMARPPSIPVHPTMENIHLLMVPPGSVPSLTAGSSQHPCIPCAAAIPAAPLYLNDFAFQATLAGGPSTAPGGPATAGAPFDAAVAVAGIAVGSNANIPGLGVVGTVKNTQKKKSMENAAAENEQPFIFPRCGLPFRLSGTLNRHVRIVHEKQRPYPCGRCSETLSERNDLIRHCRLVAS